MKNAGIVYNQSCFDEYAISSVYIYEVSISFPSYINHSNDVTFGNIGDSVWPIRSIMLCGATPAN